MAEALAGPGLIAQLRDRLVVSASARHLAVDLIARHGDGAGEAARALAARAGLSPRERQVLARALPMIADLLDRDGTPAPRPALAPRAMAVAVRVD